MVAKDLPMVGHLAILEEAPVERVNNVTLLLGLVLEVDTLVEELQYQLVHAMLVVVAAEVLFIVRQLKHLLHLTERGQRCHLRIAHIVEL
jgi:hypothetical protein